MVVSGKDQANDRESPSQGFCQQKKCCSPLLNSVQCSTEEDVEIIEAASKFRFFYEDSSALLVSLPSAVALLLFCLSV